jgi:hypothetical protein
MYLLKRKRKMYGLSCAPEWKAWTMVGLVFATQQKMHASEEPISHGIQN